MTQPIIQAENLGKRYSLGGGQGGREAVERAARYRTIRESLTETARGALRLGRNGHNGHNGHSEDFWALREVGFGIYPGEVVGIIGRNGAGKSTLLKILSRITEPTEGRVTLRGRVASLLEVGTGFHTELTGRENIFLNGSILGMSRAEIKAKFDEIVAFAEVERFLDTPVKRYSSGMYVRLAFAVAAHLEPEILIIDEVLAVGDIAFQRKCLDKMQDVGEHGRTVLFVSHNMPAVNRLCSRAILLDGGRVVRQGPTQAVVGSYLQSGLGTMAERRWPAGTPAPASEAVRLRSVRVCLTDGATAETADIRQPVGVEMEYEVLRDTGPLTPNLHLANEEGLTLFHTHDLDPEWRGRPRPAGVYRSTAWVPGNFLSEGMVIVGAAISTYTPLRVHFYERDAVAFQVVDSLEGDSARGDYAGTMPGAIRPWLTWTTRAGQDAPPVLPAVETLTPQFLSP